MIQRLIQAKITKEEISKLPTEEFKGRIVILSTERDAEKAVNYLLHNASMVGFDTETRPSFKKGRVYKVALMQVSTEDTCFLFRLNRIDLPDSLKAFLKDESVLKIGLSLRDDFSAIRKRMDKIDLNNFLDLQAYVGKFGIEDASLQKIYAILFGKRISKGQRLSNWEAETLTEAQQKYASLDAWACLEIYKTLHESEEDEAL